MEKLMPIELPYKKLKGISHEQVSEHFEVLYKGYVKKVNEIRERLSGKFPGLPNPTYDEFREFKLEESFALNAVKLHEAYFLGLGGATNQTVHGGDGAVPDEARKIIAKDFCSFENWQERFYGLGLAARGWAVLYYDLDEKRLYNGLGDFHSHGGVWNAKPILVLDVYEHAYFMDFGAKRKNYLDAYFNNLDWQYILDELKNIKKWP